MGLFDGFPFVSKEERERRRRDFEKRVTPFGVEEQRDKLKSILSELFPDADLLDALFVYFDSKDAYNYKETKEEGIVAAKMKMKRARWVDERKQAIILKLIDIENGLTSLDDYPTANDVLKDLYGQDNE